MRSSLVGPNDAHAKKLASGGVEIKSWLLVVMRARRAGRTLAAVTRDRQRCGRDGETRAAAFLAACGFTILARNVRAQAGEIDVVALEGPTLVFCEIRTRRTRARGGALESVTPAKQRQVVRVARWFLACHPELAGRPVRFDVVAVELRGEAVELTHVRDAFDAA